MLRKWAKWLPYWVVMKYTRKFSASFIETKKLGKCMGWRIDKGEWILYSKDNYDKMRANELKYQKSKEEKKRSQVYKKFRKDYEFKRQAKEIFEEEERQRKEEAEWE